ncbi:MAG TPA: cation transporter [Syntrophales bacterium]|nr:cation transporter [Syntrophales bacterium]
MDKSVANTASLYRVASILAVVTIAYNTLEGLVSVYFGAEDSTLALFGFGLDSFVEVISGIGIWHMIQHIQRQPESNPDRFESTALRITGSAFYLLFVGLTISALLNLYRGHKPETTFWGIVIALISISVMWVLIRYKVKVGRQLHSDAILADANCSRVCLWLSWVLLLASTGYELTGIGGMDAVGAIIIAVFSFREGRESFEKAKGGDLPLRDLW